MSLQVLATGLVILGMGFAFALGFLTAFGANDKPKGDDE